MMKRILLNTAFATVLYLFNTTYASDIDQDNAGKSSFHLQPGNVLPDEISLEILKHLSLKDWNCFSQVSRDCQRLASDRDISLDKMSYQANPNFERPLNLEFTCLLESIRKGRGKFTIHSRFPYAYAASANPDERDQILQSQVHGIDDNGRFILKKDIKPKKVYIKSRQSNDYYHTFPNTTDNNTYVGFIKDLMGEVFIYTIEVGPLLNQDSININPIVPQAYIQDNDMNQIPVSIKSYKYLPLLVPQNIVESNILGISSDKQAVFGFCRDIEDNVQGFNWTRENGMQKLKNIAGLPEENSKLSIAYPNCITDKGEITGGFSLFPNKKDIACIWAGKQNAVFSLQKLIQLGPNPIPKNISLANVLSISPNGKAMLGQGYLGEEDAAKQFWWTYVISSDDASINNNMATLSIN